MRTCFKLENFFHSIYFRDNMISTICKEIIRDTDIWNYQFKLFYNYNYISVKYNLQLKDISLDKFKKFKSCDIYFHTIYKKLGSNDINIKEKSFIPKNNPYNLPINTSVLCFLTNLKIFKK